MGPDCTDFFFKEQLPQVGFHFCFTRAVLSPGWPAGARGGARGAGRPPAPRGRGGGRERGPPLWFLCSVRKTNQVVALASLPRGRRPALPRAADALRIGFANLLTLVLFIVHDYGQLGCHFFQIPV